MNPAVMTPGVWGNSGRNILIGPGFQNWDVSLLKNIRLAERRKLQFRAESFNVFNHTNFTGVSTTVAVGSTNTPVSLGTFSVAGPSGGLFPESVNVNVGRRIHRRRMASSCRSTTISSSLKSFDRTRRTASRRTRRSTT